LSVPKLKFWNSNLKIRSFARLKAWETARAWSKTVRVSAQSISFGTGSIVYDYCGKESVQSRATWIAQKYCERLDKIYTMIYIKTQERLNACKPHVYLVMEEARR
jgi:hypothetical protein